MTVPSSPSPLPSTSIPTPTATATSTTPWTDPAHALWPFLLFACALANVVALWSGPYLPFTDLPQHAAAIATLRHWSDPQWKAQEYFTLALGRSQYLLYYLAGAVLAFPLGSAELANLTLLSATALAFPLALRSLLRAVRGDERLALFAAPLFWSQSLLIGFFNYLAALPLLLWGLSLAVRDAEAPRPRRTVLVAAVALALFYLHLSAFLLFAPAALLAWLLLGRGPRALLWVVPVAALGFAFLATSPVIHPEKVGWTHPMEIRFEAPSDALRNLPSALLDIWPGTQDDLVLLALIGAAALLAWPQPRDPDADARLRGLAAGWCALAAFLYFAFPVSIGWLWQLNERYAIALALLAPLLLRPARGLRGALPLVLVAAASLFSAGIAGRQIRGFSREVEGFDRVLDATEPGRRLLSLIYGRDSAWAKFSPYLHFGSYYRARKGGIASFSFAELPQSPLRYRPETAPPPKPAHWEWEPWSFRNDVDGLYYDYLLVRGFGDPAARAGPGPAWHVLSRAGAWTLYTKE
ncbi:MAG TPA: hypothetical protein VKC58_01760 [Myxococcales bacterium]|nr:hypothetical protein [Myxococcales bacterium]